MGLFSKNPFKNFFNKNQSEVDIDRGKAIEKNSHGLPGISGEVDQEIINLIDDLKRQAQGENKGNYSFSNQSAIFESIFSSKKGKIYKYNEMIKYPEIAHATSITINESINQNESGNICELIFKDNGPDNELPEAVQKIYRQVFFKVYNEIYDFDNTADILFEKFLIESELYVEFILNKEKDDIIGFQILPCYTMLPVYGSNNLIKGYLQCNDIVYDQRRMGTPIRNKDKQYRDFETNQVAYANSGKYGFSVFDIRGYLDPIIKTYNHIKTIDDALAIYRWVRAPETRLWNVYTGKMSVSKQQNFLKQVISKFSKKNDYNFATGEINQQANIRSLVEDLWFTKDDTGNQTTVDTLSGGMQLGEIDDVKYYLSKLYKGLHIPKGRWDLDEGKEHSTRNDSIAVEELQFNKFISKLHRNFKVIFTNPIETLLKINGVEDKYIDSKYYDIKFTLNNKWQQAVDAEQWDQKLKVWSTVDRWIYDPNNQPEGWLSKEFVLKDIMKLSANDYAKNEELLAKQKEEAGDEVEEETDKW